MVSTAAAALPGTRRRLHYLPIALYGAVMGLAATGSAWKLAQARFATPGWVADLWDGLTILTFLVLTVAYLIKWASAPAVVRSEFDDPSQAALFGTLTGGVVLLSSTLVAVNVRLAQSVWALGSVLSVLFAWRMASRWMEHPRPFEEVTAAWIMPVVAVLDIPLTLPQLELPPLHQLEVACLAIGLFFAGVLFVVVYSRLLFQPTPPDAQQPIFFVLMSPFAVGFLAYVNIRGRIDTFAEGLFWVGLFIGAVLLRRLRFFPACCPFKVSWWAISFPLAALATAALRFDAQHRGALYDTLAVALLAFATLVVAALLVRTLVGVLRGELRRLSP